MPDRIGRYRISRVLGQGGMGVVYAALDERLEREVAIKVIRPEILADPTVRNRFQREARAAARVSHPHICTLFELDEADGQPYLVMELLDGESLAACLERGRLPQSEALSTADAMLDALGALHDHGIVHRDLKPANIFMTSRGVKLVDFGLAQPVSADRPTGSLDITDSGVLAGTPRYMAPERLDGQAATPQADIFAAGAVIYEMLVGRPAFDGRSLVEVVHAIAQREPPSIEGSAALQAIDRVIRRALAKDPAARFSRADELRAALRAAERGEAPAVLTTARPGLLRFVALPLRILKPDADTDFLAWSLPDAVSAALSNIASVVVRSPRATSENADVRAIGRDLAVDVVLTGTLLRAGDEVRVAAQLSDAASGTLIWSTTAQAPMSDLFQLQDALARRIVTSLAPIAGELPSLERQAPTSAAAYELYMRANGLMSDASQWDVARQLYEQALALDPTYAPAWARLGRVRRLLAKWNGKATGVTIASAEDAFRRALELSPDLSVAHDLSAYAEAELGLAPAAMERLLRRAATRRTDVGLLAGLVTTCRYAGLLDASLAAHARGVSVDPALITSVNWTHFLRGDYAKAIETDRGTPPFSAISSRIILGTIEPGELLQAEMNAGAPGAKIALRASYQLLTGRVDLAIEALRQLRSEGFDDPEGHYIYALRLAQVGATDEALAMLTEAVEKGYACHEPLTREPAWTALAGRPAYDAAVRQTAALVRAAHARFEAAGGHEVLSLPADRPASTTA